MPLYEYRCDLCGHQLEVLQSIKDQPLRECPQCGNQAMRKLVHAPAFTFKGSGWYKDLYGSSGAAKDTEASKTKEAGTAKTSTESDKKSKPSTDSASATSSG